MLPDRPIVSSSHASIVEALDSLAESVVFTDLTDTASSTAILDALTTLGEAAGDDASKEFAAAIAAAKAVATQALRDAEGDPEAARVRLSAVVSTLTVLVSRGGALESAAGDSADVTGSEDRAAADDTALDAETQASDDADADPVEAAADDVEHVETSDVVDGAGAAASAEVYSFLGDEELILDFVTRALEHMSDAEAALIRLESDPKDAESVNLVLASFHTVKGMAGFLQLAEIETHSHDAETILAAYRDTTDPVPASVTAAMFRAVDRMRALVLPLCPDAGMQAVPSAFEGPADISSVTSPRARAKRETIRVDAARFDQLLDAIGELVIAEASVSRLAAEDVDRLVLSRQIESLDKITRSLQEMATLLRMVDLDETFRRMQRVVRDVAQRQGRAVEFSSEGEDTRLDKTIVDAISDPLVHLLRNAVDHGLAETPEQRTAAGKPEFGRISLRAFHRGGSVYIEVEDDGRGLDREAILVRAIERGLIAPGEQPTDRVVFGMIFEPGFSTRDVVTDVSGRGVGMDVVRRTVEALRGSAEVRSERGAGTLISLRLPLTLAIIDGMLVRVGDECYVVPTLSVVRSVRPAADEIVEVLGEAEMLRQPDGVMRLIRLGELLGVDGAENDPEQAIAVVLEDDGERFAILVDELLGKQQVVIKPLTGPVAASPAISGASVMADGAAGLILDIAGLVRMSGVATYRDDRADTARSA